MLNFHQICGLVRIKIHFSSSKHDLIYIFRLITAESFVGKGRVYKGIRRHARARFGQVEYKHVHYFVRLEEGSPPENYYNPAPLNPEQQLDKWLDSMRKRKVTSSL